MRSPLAQDQLPKLRDGPWRKYNIVSVRIYMTLLHLSRQQLIYQPSEYIISSKSKPKAERGH